MAQWNKLSVAQQAAVVAGGVAQFGLLGAALWDLRRRSPAQVNGSKRFWTVFVFLNFVGPAAYFARGRKAAS